MKIRALFRDGVTTVEALIQHPMVGGQRKDPDTGEIIGAYFIQEVTAEYEGRPMLHALWGPGVSEDPYLAFKFRGGRPGEKVTVIWMDNKGRSGSRTEAIR